MLIMDVANKEPVHLDEETVESLRKAICLADDAVADANRLRDEWVDKAFCLWQYLITSKEEEQEAVLELLLEAQLLVSKWMGAISYALMMKRRAEITVDALFPLVGEKVERETLAALKARSKWLELKWQHTWSDVEKVNQSTTDAVKQWKEAAVSSGGLIRKMLDARSASQAVEKIRKIAGWYREEQSGYHVKFSHDLFPFQFQLEGFRLPYEMKEILLQLEARSSPACKAYSLNIAEHLTKVNHTNKEEATKDMQQAVLTANEAIVQMIHFLALPAHSINGIVPLIKPDKIIGNLADVKNWTSALQQMVTSVGNALWQIVQTIDVLLSTVGKSKARDEAAEERTRLCSPNLYEMTQFLRACSSVLTKNDQNIQAEDEAEKMFQSWYPYMYGIQKLYHHIVKAEAGWCSLADTEKQFSHSWYQYEFSTITETKQKVIEATLWIRYQFNWMFYDDDDDYYRPWHRPMHYNQDRLAQISYDWTLFQANLLELETSSPLLFHPQNRDNALCSSLDSMHNSSQNTEPEIVKSIKRMVPNMDQLIIRATGFKWPGQKRVSLLQIEKSSEILTEVESLISDWSQTMPAIRDTIQEMIALLQVLSGANPTLRTKVSSAKATADWFFSCCCPRVDDMKKLLYHIIQTKRHWQALLTPKETLVTGFSLNSAPVSETETGASTKLAAKIRANMEVSLHLEETLPLLQEQTDSDSTTAEEQQAISAIQQLVALAKKTWGFSMSYLTGQYYEGKFIIKSDGQISTTTHKKWSPCCLSYGWIRLKANLLNL
jgi:hypothetical protein